MITHVLHYRLITKAALLAAAVAFLVQQTTATAGTATLSGTGNWSDSTKWTSTPAGFAPNNGNNGENWSATVSANTVTLDAAVIIQSLTFNAGTINGASNLTTNAASIWTGGTMSGAGVTQANGGLTLSGAGGKILSVRTLNNAGTLSWTGGNILANDGAILNNEIGATFTTNFDAAVTNAGVDAIFNNVGTFTKTAGAGTTTIGSGVSFNNTGIVNVNSGTLSLGGGGTSSGAFNLASGTTLDLSGGTHAFNAGTTLSAPAGSTLKTSGTANITMAIPITVSGDTNLTGGTLTFNDTTSLVTLSMSGNSTTLGGTGTVTVSGAITWSGGIMSGAGVTQANGGMTLSAGGNHQMSVRTVNNAGTASWTAGSIFISDGAIFNNEAGATFTTDFSGVVVNLGIDGIINNAGTFNKTAGGGTGTIIDTSVSFNNTGTVNVTGGTLEIKTIVQHSGATLTGGTWNVSNGAVLNTLGSNITTNGAASSVTLDGAGSTFAKFTTALNNNQGGLTLKNDRDLTTAGAFANSGTVSVQDSTTVMTIGAGGGSSYTQTGGFTILAGGAMIDSSAFNLNGGTLSGTGIIDAPLATSGTTTIAPGASPGTITINGSTVLGSGNTLTMEVGGLASGVDYDVLVVNGILTLGGLLDVDFINGFQNSLQSTDAFTIATATSPILGAFSNAASGSLITTNFAQLFYVFYGAGSPFNANTVVLTQMPEPSRALLVLLGFGTVMMRRRRICRTA